MSSARAVRQWLMVSAALAIVLGVVAITNPQPEQAWVAVVRDDGSMIPIAAYDGQQWWNRWPSASAGADLPPVPFSLSSIPSAWLPPGMQLPVEWRLQAPERRQVRIKALRPIRTFMLEEQVIGLQSDYTFETRPR